MVLVVEHRRPDCPVCSTTLEEGLRTEQFDVLPRRGGVGAALAARVFRIIPDNPTFPLMLYLLTNGT